MNMNPYFADGKHFETEPYKPERLSHVMVATLNIAGQLWMGLSERLASLKFMFKHIKAEIIGFQEFGKNNQKILEEIRSDYDYVPGEELGDIIVNPIAYNHMRFVPLEFGTVWLSEHQTKNVGWDASGIRAFTWAKFEDCYIKNCLVYINTHFDNVGIQARVKSAEQIVNFVENNFADTPTIIGGDLNFALHTNFEGLSEQQKRYWHDEERKKPHQVFTNAGFVEGWQATHRNTPRPNTFHDKLGLDNDPTNSLYPTNDLDYLYGRGVKILGCKLNRDSLGGIEYSDHYAVMMWFRYESLGQYFE